MASTNLQDFYNLVDVYLDAVFHPRCVEDPPIFAQEGWHYELDDTQVRAGRRCAAPRCSMLSCAALRCTAA